MSKKTLWGAGAVLILLILGLVVYSVSQKTSPAVSNDFTGPDADMAAIRTFMGEPDLALQYQSTQAPENFTVGATKSIGSGDVMATVPDKWKRSVDVYVQTTPAKDCQFYTYEVDARYPQVVQVQLGPVLPVGSDMANAQAACLKANPPQPVTEVQAKTMALAIAHKSAGDLVDPGHPYVLQNEPSNTGDRYDFVWQYKDNSELGPDLTSSPWPYPTVRVVFNKNGYLMTYLNTAILYAPE